MFSCPLPVIMYLLPSLMWADGTVLSLCVCVCVAVCGLPQNCCILQLSQHLNKLQVTNLVTKSVSLQDRQVLAGKHGSSSFKFGNKKNNHTGLT